MAERLDSESPEFGGGVHSNLGPDRSEAKQAASNGPALASLRLVRYGRTDGQWPTNLSKDKLDRIAGLRNSPFPTIWDLDIGGTDRPTERQEEECVSPSLVSLTVQLPA